MTGARRITGIVMPLVLLVACAAAAADPAGVTASDTTTTLPDTAASAISVAPRVTAVADIVASDTTASRVTAIADIVASNAAASRVVAASESAASDSTAFAAAGLATLPSSFELRLIPRAEFPLARPLVTARRSSEAAPRLPLRPLARLAPAPWERSLPWDQANGEFSEEASRPRVGAATSRERLRLDLADYLPGGKLEMQSELLTHDGHGHLLRRRLGFASKTGWKVDAGDAPLLAGSPGARGTSARGLLFERHRGGDGRSRAWRAGGLLGSLPVSYAGFESGAFPRRFGAGYWRLERPRGTRLQGLLYALTGGAPAADGTAERFRDGQGAGLSFGVPVVRGRRVDLLGDVFATRSFSSAGGAMHGLAGDLSAQGEVRRFSLGGHVQAGLGKPRELGYLGALQPVPGLTQEMNITYRAPEQIALTGWAGRWMNPVLVNRGQTGGGVSEYRAHGNQVGGRATWRAARTGTGLSASHELRHREGDLFHESVTTSGASVSQPLGPGRSSTLEWSRIAHRGRGARDYVSGSLSLRVGPSGTLSLQQRVAWQEPYGARVESFVDFTGLSIPRPLVTLSGQLGVTGDGTSPGVPRLTQTIGRVEAVMHPNPRLMLVARYGINSSSTGLVHTVTLSVTHSTGRAGGAAGPRLDPTVPERIILRGRVFEDRDGDGRWQQGEPGIAGVEISVDGDARQPLVTGADGVFRAFVHAGKHVIRILPASVPTRFSIDGIEPLEVEVVQDDVLDLSLPLTRSVGWIHGRVVDDRDSSGVANAEILIDGKDFTLTDAAGDFHFGPLPTGEHELRVATESLPFGYRVEQGALRVRLTEAAGAGTGVVFHVSRPVQQMEF